MFAVILLFLSSLNLSIAAPSSRQAYIKAHEQLVTTLVTWEKQRVWKLEVTGPTTLQTWRTQFQRLLLEEAIADGARDCFFGGWLSQRRTTTGSCMPPWSARQFAQNNGASTYGPACGGTQFRCNPGVFGPGLCVSTAAGYSGLTVRCAEASQQKAENEGRTHWLEALSDEEFQTWKETTFRPLSAQARNFCQQNPEMYRDNTCVKLLETLAVAEQQERQQPQAQPQQQASSIDSGSINTPEPENQSAVTADTENSGTGQSLAEPASRVVVSGGTLSGIGGGGGGGGGIVAIDAVEADQEVATPIIDPSNDGPQTIPPRLFFSSVVGGSANDNFLDDGITDARAAAQALGSSSGSFLFGGPDRDGQCRSNYDGTMNINGGPRSIDEIKRNFMTQRSCQNATEMTNYMLGQGGGIRAVCTSDSAISAPASEAGVNSLWQNTANYQPGDVFYLHIADHGGDPALCGGDKYCIFLSDGSSIGSDQLMTRVESLARRGINVQLSLDACFSGGFAKEMNEMRTRLRNSGTQLPGRFCATTSQDPTLAGYGSDPLLTAGYSESYFPALQQYGNQLSASACAAGKDMINDPTSSLEEFVRGWLRERGGGPSRAEGLSGQCGGYAFPAAANTELANTIEAIQSSLVRLKAEALFNDFRQYWVRPLNECWQTRQQELAFTEKLHSCMSSVTGIGEDIRQMVTESLERSTRGAQNDMGDLRAFTAFFKDPNLQDGDLEKFKDDFCCLARNLKTGELPPSCRNAP